MSQWQSGDPALEVRPAETPRARPRRDRLAAVRRRRLGDGRDRNDDRIPDRWEKQHGLSLKVDQARRDQDRDGFKNRAEWRAKTDPRDADSDGDGVDDSDENAGTVTAYADGVLTITLFADGERADRRRSPTRPRSSAAATTGPRPP